ncbi:hypothetical protein Y027_5229 [Burkholderia pseudomallei TSV5]|nr:hypothetical protein Y027_5229 [Burkholderia pseudomallei TSV5]
MPVDRSRPAARARKSPRPRVAPPEHFSRARHANAAHAHPQTRRNGIAGLPFFGLTISIANLAVRWHTPAFDSLADAADTPLRRRPTWFDVGRSARGAGRAPAPRRSPNGADRQTVKKLRIIRDMTAEKRMEPRNFWFIAESRGTRRGS